MSSPVYKPHGFQKAAHKAFLIDGYKYGVLYWGRRCFAAGTPVTLASGVQRPIEDVRPGMWVVSYNEELGIAEPKEVLEHHSFGVDQDPKPMIQWSVDGKTITSTYDHEYYSDGQWVPAYKLAWGKMAPRQRLQLKLLCKQYGQTFDDDPSWRTEDNRDEASFRRFWVFQDSNERQNGQSTSGSSPDLDKEPPKQATSQSHRPRPDEQSDRQPGVGNKGRERGSYDESRTADQKSRREVRHTHPNGSRSLDNIGDSTEIPSHEQTGTKQVDTLVSLFSNKAGQYQRYFEGEDLEISETRVLEAQPTYDLTVADNHNYVVYDLLVHNTGKTLWSIQQIMWSCMLNQGQHHIVFKEYEAAQKVSWEQYLHLIPKELIAKTDKSTLTVFFHHFDGEIEWLDGSLRTIRHDPTKPPSTLRMLGSDKADSHRGLESHGMIFDEYQEHDPYGWAAVYSKYFATTNGWACFMGTAKDRDSWNELLDYAQAQPEWYFSRATWEDVPHIDKAWVAQDRKQAENRDELGLWLQEMELIPFSQQGAVYPNFSKDIHVIDQDKVPEEGTDYVALDFGFAEGHPLALCFIRITRDDVWYQYDEILGTQIQLEDALAEMKYKLGDRRLAGIVADSARPDLIEWMASKGYPVIPAPKKQNSVLAGIDLLRKRIKPKVQIIGEPKPNYYVTRNCKKTIYQWTHYRFKEIKEDRPPTELPEKRHDDALDAIRYLELHFKFGHPTDEKIPDSSVLKDFMI